MRISSADKPRLKYETFKRWAVGSPVGVSSHSADLDNGSVITRKSSCNLLFVCYFEDDTSETPSHR